MYGERSWEHKQLHVSTNPKQRLTNGLPVGSFFFCFFFWRLFSARTLKVQVPSMTPTKCEQPILGRLGRHRNGSLQGAVSAANCAARRSHRLPQPPGVVLASHCCGTTPPLWPDRSHDNLEGLLIPASSCRAAIAEASCWPSTSDAGVKESSLRLTHWA